MNFAFLFAGQSFIIVLCAIILSGVLRGYSGFGAALIIIPIFSNLYSPIVALSFHVLIEMPSLAVLLPVAMRSYDRKLVNSSLFILILAVPFGFYFISLIDTTYLRLFIGAFVIVSVYIIWRGIPLKISRNENFFRVACGASGFCQGLMGLGGPPVVTTLMSRGDDNITSRANIIIVMTVLLLSSLLAQLYHGTVDLIPVTLAMTLFAPYLAGNQIGKWLFFRYPNDAYRKVTLLCLALIGLHSILSAIDAFYTK
jgi:uncharacterized membrane protein YfcA